MGTPVWTLRLQRKDGTYIADVPFFNLQGEFRMNQPDEIRFSMHSKDIENYVSPLSELRAGYTEVKLLRDSTAIFTGPIWKIGVSSQDNQMKVTANDISSYLKVRNIYNDTKFTKKRFAYMAWKLISDAQALSYGSLGISLGNDPAGNPTGSSSFTKKSGTKIYDAISKLADGDNGFDWEITPDRVFNMYYPRLATYTNIILQHNSNIRRYYVVDYGSQVANDIFIRGGNKVVSNTVTDGASMASYGRRQYTTTYSSVKSKIKLNGIAARELSVRREPNLLPEFVIDVEKINPYDDGFTYGALFQTIVDDGWVQLNTLMRCAGWQLTIGKHGQETYVLYLNDTREVTGSL